MLIGGSKESCGARIPLDRCNLTSHWFHKHNIRLLNTRFEAEVPPTHTHHIDNLEV